MIMFYKDLKVKIESFEQIDIDFDKCLIVKVKYDTLWIVAVVIISFLLFIFLTIKLNQYFVAIGAFFMLCLYLFDSFLIYFPFKLPLLIINEHGVQFKKKFFMWQEIKEVSYEIKAKGTNRRTDYLNLLLINKKEISIYIGRHIIDSSIEIIANYINHYRGK